jgi:FKBP-type peptidyl-prolyl cis-trans isomerase
MLKNKYVLGVLIGLAVFAISAAGGILLLGKDTDKQAALNGATSASDTGDGQPITLSQDTMTGVQIAGNDTAGGGSSSGSSSAASDTAKLLDPTTFAQYDKYKTAQSTQFVDLQKGTGTTITGGSQVAVVYRGWLTNGTLFDQSKTGTDGKLEAFGFVVGQHQVIPGWESGLEGAKDGGVRLLIIPPALGYGAAGQGPIPGDSVLVFQVQIVQVK